MTLSPELQLVLYDTPLLLVYSFVFGAIWGSYLNVCIYRIPACLSTAHPRSRCPKCETPIKGYDNIPILSWLILRGKCRSCKNPISPRYMLVETLTGVLFVAVFYVYGISWMTPIYWLMVFGLLLGTFVDLDEQWLPDRVTKGGIIFGLILSCIYPMMHGFTYWRFGLMASIGGAAIGFGLLWLVVELGKLFLGRVKFLFDEPIHWVLQEQKALDEPKMPPIPFFIVWYRALAPRIVPAKKEQIETWVHEYFIKLPEPIEPVFSFFDDPKALDSATEKDAEGNILPTLYHWSEVYARKTDAVHLRCQELTIDGEAIRQPGEIHIFQDRLIAGDREFPLDGIKHIQGLANRIVLPREAMGFGDVKLLGAIGAFLGWQGALFSLVGSAFIGTICGVTIGLISRQGIRGVRIPYGPYIAAGALLWIFWGEDIWQWYWGVLTLSPQSYL
ncbi:MAG: leader peptidase (prepilin peptidase)/N-methyltransferase [Verrucomicrobiales bacterium]|jgi:leader peptidase (prepilin peptidase) / N-methyltransferase